MDKTIDLEWWIWWIIIENLTCLINIIHFKEWDKIIGLCKKKKEFNNIENLKI